MRPVSDREKLIDFVEDNLRISSWSKLSCHPSLRRGVARVVVDIIQSSNVNRYTLPTFGGWFTFNGNYYFVEMKPYGVDSWQLKFFSREMVLTRHNSSELNYNGVGFISDKVIKQLQGY